jgi:hypothetical protein
MFDIVRFWAYQAVRQYLNSGFDNWHTAVLEQAMSANGAFLEPLPYSEVKATAKSISRWVWRNHAQAYATFIERQSTKGKIGAAVANSKGHVALEVRLDRHNLATFAKKLLNCTYRA